MLKHVAVSPHRARADSVSLSSSASCCSLGSLENRHDSVTDLSHRTVSNKNNIFFRFTLNPAHKEGNLGTCVTPSLSI